MGAHGAYGDGGRAYAGLAMVAAATMVVGYPTGVRAWTETHVQSARAHVDVQPSGQSLVALELDVKVRRGWLEGLEVAGLDRDLDLVAAKPPWVVSDEGHKYIPDARVRSGGRVQMRFSRSRAPRRGSYRIGFVYQTDLAHRATEVLDDRHIRVRWGLPGWRTGLDAVRVTLSVPAGGRFADTPAGPATEMHRQRAGSRTVLTWTRAHLPRTVSWTVAADVPVGRMDPGLAVPDTGGEDAPGPVPKAARPDAAQAETSYAGAGLPSPEADKVHAGREGQAPLLAVLALVCLLTAFSLGKMFAHARAAHRRRAQPRAWIALPHPLARTVLILTAALMGAWSWIRVGPDVGLATLGLVPLLAAHRTALSPRIPRLGAWTGLGPVHRRQAVRALRLERWTGLAWLDVASPLGWCTVTAICATVVYLDRLDPTMDVVLGLLLLLPVWLTGSRAQLPTPAHARLRLLLDVARELRLPLAENHPAVALRPVVHQDAEGNWQDVRVHLLSAPASGLLRFDLALGERRTLGGYVSEPALVAVCRAGTPADAALARAWKGVWVQPGPAGRIARIAPLRDELLRDALDTLLPRPKRGQANSCTRLFPRTKRAASHRSALNPGTG